MKEIRKKMWGYKKKIWGYQKNLRMKKIRKKSGVTNFCVKCKRIPFTIPKKVQILNVSNIVHKNIVHKNIVPHFWRGMKILSIYPNVGHSKSGRKLLSPRVDNL